MRNVPGPMSSGSSPLARGTLIPDPERRHSPRFIPARAGNTRRPGPPTTSSSVHPRSRGEHVSSSRCRLGFFRFIPARAGNTPPRTGMDLLLTVHPRSRGEHYTCARFKRRFDGSSPLARGTPPAVASRLPEHRFIPARAGNTSSAVIRPAASPVHPRSRGEHRPPSRPAFPSTGSSPLARGTHPVRARDHRRARFIPARAGNTRPPPARRTPATVHPRSRGEHRTTCSPPVRPTGSSPLARGTLVVDPPARLARRFIPARAGNTGCARRAGPPRSVHPRSRGEHTRQSSGSFSPAGSSPLARGTLADPSRRERARRFIPARAGNTLENTGVIT